MAARNSSTSEDLILVESASGSRSVPRSEEVYRLFRLAFPSHSLSLFLPLSLSLSLSLSLANPRRTFNLWNNSPRTATHRRSKRDLASIPLLLSNPGGGRRALFLSLSLSLCACVCLRGGSRTSFASRTRSSKAWVTVHGLTEARHSSRLIFPPPRSAYPTFGVPLFRFQRSCADRRRLACLPGCNGVARQFRLGTTLCVSSLFRDQN